MWKDRARDRQETQRQRDGGDDLEREKEERSSLSAIGFVNSTKLQIKKIRKI